MRMHSSSRVRFVFFRARWFVLTGRELQYFEGPDDTLSRGAISLAAVTSVAPTRKHMLGGSEPGLHVNTAPGRAFHIKCGTVEERDAWIAAIDRARLRVQNSFSDSD